MKVQFSDLSGEKIRPVVVIGTDDQDDDVTVVFVTSSPPRIRFDVRVAEWSLAGLLKPSTARASKFLTVHPGRFLKQLGTLSDFDFQAVMAAARSYHSLS
ncbi:type II toxin-antitoxin system PemK/MazF family toxin [Alicyclobacillus hesperidum]|uniref:type II toxin-antitoxin system PemK/MazF family toxin n=1 Tax=Alicyclobacillus hesperidum TaxID=89784 RepID=UPI0015A3E945|nr:type II toxin-antitoxin system PemK/MazF family toxin [Alicyclobacillus hesperidum]